DNVDRIAGTIGYIDQAGRRSNFGAKATHPFRHGKPVGVALRRELAATGMKRISSCFGSEWVNQESARSGVSGNDLLQSTLEIALRLLVGPLGAPRRQYLQVKT